MVNHVFWNNRGKSPDRLTGTASGRMIAHGPRVLVVDDDLPVRIVLTRMLRAWGYGVQHVGSAVEALEVMASEPADILLCDVEMPEHDGLWLAEQAHGQWPQTAIVMSTACQDSHIVQTSRRLGAVAYVTKPFIPCRLREALDHAAHLCCQMCPALRDSDPAGYVGPVRGVRRHRPHDVAAQR